MAYRIAGLDKESFEPLFGLDDEALAARNARRVTADSPTGFPCRVSLVDAAPGERLILLNHVSLDVPTPYRTAYAIYVREAAEAVPCYKDQVPPLLERRTLGLRGFDGEGMLKHALLAGPGETDAKLRELFERADIASVHVHNAVTGCFLARAERD